MKKDDLRNNVVHVRLNDKELADLKNMAKEANMSQSRLLREGFKNSTLKYVNNGKEIVQNLSKIHRNFQNYHIDMERRIEDLTNAINRNSDLLQQHNMSNSPQFVETFNFQRQQISAISNTLMHHYSETQRMTEDYLHDTYKWIL